MLTEGEQGRSTGTGREKAATRTWSFQELSFPLLEEGRIVGAAHVKRGRPSWALDL